MSTNKLLPKYNIYLAEEEQNSHLVGQALHRFLIIYRSFRVLHSFCLIYPGSCFSRVKKNTFTAHTFIQARAAHFGLCMLLHHYMNTHTHNIYAASAMRHSNKIQKAKYFPFILFWKSCLFIKHSV